MRCEELEPFVEAIADGTGELAPAGRDHLATCPACTARVAQAREIDRFLAMRETPLPPATFTAMIMARIVRESLKAERVVDIGFNLALVAGVIVILTSAAGVAWSLGLLTVRIDVEAIENVLSTDIASRVLSQAQTVTFAAGLLTMALVLWWWAERESV